MAITLRWYTAEKTALSYTVQGNWTWYSVYSTVGRAQSILDRLRRRVDLLLDFSTADDPQFTTLRWSVSRIASIAHPRLGIAIIVGDTALAQIFSHAFHTTGDALTDDFRLHQVATLDAACILLEARCDPSSFYIPRRAAQSSG